MSGGSQANSVSDGTTRFHSLFSVFFSSISNRLLCNEDSLEDLVHMGSTLDSVIQAPTCLSSSLIGCAVDAIGVQLGLETDLHPPDTLFVGQRTRGVARGPQNTRT